jgi:hypothetical protein
MPNRAIQPEELGQAWAQAFLDDKLRALFEVSPRGAVVASRLEEYRPLFDFKNGPAGPVYEALECLPHKRLEALADGDFKLTDTDITNIVSIMRKGNTWVLREKATRTDLCQVSVKMLEEGSNPASALTLKDWIRVYALAVLEENGFGKELGYDPTRAIESFPEVDFHNLLAPIFEFPTRDDLLRSSGLPAELQTDVALTIALAAIKDGSHAKYDAYVLVKLSC